MSDGLNTPGASPALGRSDLPAEPLHLSDVPAGTGVKLGRLVTYAARTGRPFVGVLVACRRCGRPHTHPWRWDWGLSAGVVSFQASRCARGPRRPRWVALDPAAAAENAAVHAEAHEAYAAWKAAEESVSVEDRRRRNAARKANRKAARITRSGPVVTTAAAEPPVPVAEPRPAPAPRPFGFHMPPVGQGGSRRG